MDERGKIPLGGRPAPTGTVTFLFTDIAGSTALWAEHREVMEANLLRHDEIVRGSIEESDGVVFSTGGDAFHAVFARAEDAVTAAVAAQRLLLLEAWRDGLVIQVRMGLHTGEAVERGGDYFGTAVNRAARLASVAHPGQIVCSSVTAQVLVDAPMSDVMLQRFGAVRLKGLSGPEEVYGVAASGLPEHFPAFPV